MDKNENYAMSRKERLLEAIDGHTYIDILLRNSINEDDLDLNSGVDGLLSQYEKLFEYGMLLSGFQFVGLVLDNKPENTREQVGYFLLGLGFYGSATAALVAFIALEYFKSLKNETPEFIIEGCMRYKWFFRSCDLILFANTFLFVLSINIMSYSLLPWPMSLTLNIIAALIMFTLMYAHYVIVLKRQIYKTASGKVVKRKIYSDNRSR